MYRGVELARVLPGAALHAAGALSAEPARRQRARARALQERDQPGALRGRHRVLALHHRCARYFTIILRSLRYLHEHFTVLVYIIVNICRSVTLS